jgi:tRNA (guanosine-2'-O-)-methyltransferase
MNDNERYDRLSAFLTDHRRALFDRIATERTRHLSVVLEDTYQQHNASAVLRTCDLLGVQDVHVIERNARWSANEEIALGASKWVDTHHHNDPLACVSALRAAGRVVVATSPHGDSYTPEDVPIDTPLAIVFGTELRGISDALAEACDLRLRIPMHGFTESYNLSVSAGIVLYTVMRRLRASAVEWRMSEADRIAMKLRWCRRSIDDAEAIERRLFGDAR